MRRLDAVVALVLGAALLSLALAAAPARASQEHLFDPVLSLEGGCEGKDGVADPGCPYPPPPPEGSGPRSLEGPCGAVADRHGDVYVATAKINNEGKGPEGRIDVFDPQGRFLTEIPDGHGPCGLAVDSEGNLFARQSDNGSVFAFEPDSYPPENGAKYAETVLYSPSEPPPGVESCLEAESVAVDPADDGLYIGHRCRIEERGTAGEGWPLLDPEVIHSEPGKSGFRGLDVYGANHDLYVSSYAFADEVPPRVFVFDGTDGHMKCEVDGSETPAGAFKFVAGPLIPGIAVDQSNGEFFVWETAGNLVDQFEAKGGECKFVQQLPSPTSGMKASDTATDIAVDDPILSGEPGYDSPNEGYVYLTSGTNKGNSHLYAFAPKSVGAPEVLDQAAAQITGSEAVLEAKVNPHGLDTGYRFEYTTQEDFEANGYAGAFRIPVPDAEAGAGGAPVPVAEPISGLLPDTAYRFRAVATNEECPAESPTAGEDEAGEGCKEGRDATFSTYPAAPVPAACSNGGLRSGISASLPDCRAYELVTPPDTGGHIPTMALPGGLNFGNNGCDSWPVSPEAGRDSVLFGFDSGSLPGSGGGGDNDVYEALRTPGTWQSGFIGLSGVQAERASPGCVSPDHRYAFWHVPIDRGTLANPTGSQYLRVPAGGPEPSSNCAPAAEPEGLFEWVGCGSLGFEPFARGKWISSGGGHVIFVTDAAAGPAQQLEPCAPPSGTGAIYDRSPGGTTHCVSLLPGDLLPVGGVAFLGASADGSAVAFANGGTLYVRLEDSKTVEVASGGSTFGGLSADGRRVFYLAGGDLFACDLGAGGCAGEGAHEPLKIGSGGESTLVNVSANGSHAYLTSKAVLTGEEESEWGAKAKAGEENLYAWDGESVRFIGVVSALDVSGEFVPDATAVVGGLGQWTSDAVASDQNPTRGPGNDPSRTSPNGRFLVFEAHAELTGYDAEGHSEIYRYDDGAPPGKRLLCVSCNPTGSAAQSDAQLQSDPSGVVPFVPFPPVSAITHIANVTADGSEVFFQSADGLVPTDRDGGVDVYEWEAQGRGGCVREAGCLSLISSGHDSGTDYLYAAKPDGSDVFFVSSDLLAPQDADGTPSVYDARVGGGFTFEGSRVPCQEEGCRPQSSVTPALLDGSSDPNGYSHSHRCPRGKSNVRRGGRTRCVSRKHKRVRHRRRVGR